MTHRNLEHYPKYSITGLANTILPNRVSFFFDLHGPSVQVDTACSSSLTCFHLGNQSLQSGESEISIIAGTALHFDPTIFITMTDFGMLSTDGRCRHFDADGSGYVRGDGICAIVLKKQSAAEMNGDNIRAIVRGSGANHDGSKEGLTMPNPVAQATLLRDTYSAAGLSPKDTGYFEAHGTGTKAGDPREAQAIGTVFAPGRDEPLYVGSIKTNLGHLEGASGLISIIKASLCLEKGKILPNMHFNKPNPEIDFEKLKIRVPQQVIDWNPSNGVRRASINSFGFGGSNAHVILENYPGTCHAEARSLVSGVASTPSRPFLLPLTSHSEDGGKRLVKSVAAYLGSSSKVSTCDLAYSLSSRRTLHSYRSFAIGHNNADISRELASPRAEARWQRSTNNPRVGFIFTGQGAQWYGMGRQLIEENSFFRQKLLECENVLQRLPEPPNWSIIEELTKSPEETRVALSQFSQPLCTAIQIALVDVLKVWNIEPTAVCGHSSGEIAAAYVAGILSLDSAIICAYYRGLYMSKGLGSTQGGMMAIGMTEPEGMIELQKYKGRIVIAAINSQSSLTVSGDKDAILELKAHLDARKVFARVLQVEQAFHSHHMEPLAPGFEKALESSKDFTPMHAKVRMFSSVTARDSSARIMDASYWSSNMTGKVRFMDAVIGILFDDNEEPAVDLLVEIGPHPALQGPVRQTIKSMGLEIPYIASLDRKVPAYESLLSCAGQLFAYGHQVDLTAVNSEHTVAEDGSAHRAVIGKYLNDLPTYAWDHKSYWSETRYSKEYRKRTHRHSLIGVPVPGSPANHRRWHSYLRGSELPWIYGHAIDGKVIFPGAGYFAMALEAVSTTIPTDRVKDIVLTDVTITSALTIPDTDVGAEVMIDLMSLETTSSRSLYKFAIYSFNDDQQTIEHCNGTVSANLGLIEESKIEHSFMDLQQRTTQSRSPRRFYERLHKMGLHYGKEFQLISGDIESSPDFAIAPLVYKPSTVNADEADACILHPAFLDCAFHTLFAALETQLGHALDDAYIPTSLRSLRVSGNLLARKNDTNDQAFWVKAQTSVLNSRINSSDISIHDGQSETCVVHLEGLECTALGLGAGEDGLRPLFFRIRWKEAFSCLGLSADSWGFEDLDTLLECYSHQYPGNKILYTPAEGSIAKEEEEEEGYDLVVCSQDYNHDPAKLLKPGGFAISTGAHFDGGTLKQKVRFGNVAIWQSESLPSSGDQLILILSSSPSAKATDLAHAIMESFHQEAMITTLEAITENAPKSGSFVSLLSLDEDVLLDTATVQSTQFLALRDLLATRKSNIVWLLENVTQSYFNPSQSLLIGMARTARSENENLRLVTLDLPEACDTKSTCKWIKHVLDPSLQDDEFAVRDGRLFIPRVEIDTKLNQKIAVGPRIQRQLQPISHDRHLRLRIETPGKLETLIFEEDVASREAPLPSGDVEILVKASVVDNTDISAISGDQRSARLGRFCVGVITKISESIGGTSLKVGDHVFAYCSKGGAHASVVRVSTSAVCHLGNVDFLSAGHAGLPLLAANYSLHQLARIQADDYCLIYNAASVAGQLAIQVALRAGARVIAIVHLPEEQANLRSRFCLPANSILLRSDEGFAQRIQRLTGRKGCHVLLNCGTSSLPPGALESLSASGLVVEFSSSDRMMSSHDSLRSNTKYTFVDLNVLFMDHPELGALLLRDSFEMLDSEEIVVPEDVATFPYSQSAEAFRALLVNPDLGHVLLHVTDDSVPVAALTYGATRLFSPEKTYLVVGGLGGIGRSLSQWMFRKGALRFAFLSRSGKDKPEAQATIEWLEKRGAMVSVYRGDVTNESDVRNCVNKIEGSLGGVFQGAMVLQSCPLSEMTPDAWQKVIDPKVKGSYNLHYATIDRHLDFFVCFSSISTIIGFMAEANYSAANSFMDHFIGWRRRQGLPGFAMNIGVVADAGQIAENEDLRAIIDRMGMDTLSEEELFYQIEEAVLSQHDPHSSLDGVVHHQLLSGINVGTKELFWSSKPLFRKLYADIKGGAADSGNDRQEDLVSALRTAEGLEAMKPILLGAFAEKISSALSIPLSVIHPGSPLSAYGMDSLVAVEFRKWFSKDVGVDLALFDILGSKTTGLLVESVCKLFLANASLKIESQPLSRDVTESKNSGSLAAITNKTFTMVRPQRIPLSTFQTRLWFMHNIMEDKAGLNLSVTLMIKGSPQLTHLKRAFVELGRRNEMLRTRYFEGNDFAEQQVLPTITTEIQYLDISSDHDPAQSVVSQAEKLRKYPTDLESGDVIRSMLLDLGNLQYAWIFSIHHIAVDGGSRKSFMGIQSNPLSTSYLLTVYLQNNWSRAITTLAPDRIHPPSRPHHYHMWTSRYGTRRISSHRRWDLI
jgi:acyl transferase domain-containing protein/NADPH:quinone reductase-like Zn-dependent oxidoreductase/NADP-dependent 3-hydroxy acid dehydrogenase YdfG